MAHSVTSIDSDMLDLQAKDTPNCNLANKLPFRLFNITWQWLIDGTGTLPPIGWFHALREDTENAQEKD